MENDLLLPVQCGWLEKMSPSRFRRWQRRFFSLQSRVLSYYDREQSVRPKGLVDLQECSLSVDVKASPAEIHLANLQSGRVYRLRAANGETLRYWVATLAIHIYSSTLDLPHAHALKKAFWGYTQILPDVFTQTAATYDLLLFKERGVEAKQQRKALGQEFNRVAILLWHGSSLNLLEACESGARLIPWAEFLHYGWHLLSSRIVYRKLVTPYREQTKPALESFIQEVQIPTSMIELTSNRLACCNSGAQLVATVYTLIGLMEPSLVFRSFQVCDFARGSEVKLKQGSWFDADCYIDF